MSTTSEDRSKGTRPLVELVVAVGEVATEGEGGEEIPPQAEAEPVEAGGSMVEEAPPWVLRPR